MCPEDPGWHSDFVGRRSVSGANGGAGAVAPAAVVTGRGIEHGGHRIAAHRRSRRGAGRRPRYRHAQPHGCRAAPAMRPGALGKSRASCAAYGGLLLASTAASADEGAVGVWVTGQFSSFAAAPASPGFSFPLVFYHATASASASRQFVIGGQVVAGIDEESNLLFLTPTWATPDAFWGADAEVSLGWAVGRVDVEVSGVINHCTGQQ